MSAQGGIDSPEQWLEAHGDALYRYALVRLRDEHKAEEVVQETLLAALQARAGFAGGASVRTWLIGILKHKIMDQFRREAREVNLGATSGLEADESDAVESSFRPDGHWRAQMANWGNPDTDLEQRHFWVVLEECLDHMPERLARLFVVREVMEETTEDICRDFGITPTNLWTMLYRARMGLRRCFERRWEQTGRH
jgi:RNA polymerase sigma-70 factor (ECF subfamily)